MNRPIISLVTAFVTAILLACNSPILNHSNADERNLLPIQDADPACPIAFPIHHLCASWTWEKMPNDQDLGSAQLRFWDKNRGTENGPFIDPKHDVFVRLWMPAMGHGSSPVTTVPVKDSTETVIPGIYESTKVFFVMPGKWEIWVQLKEGETLHEQAKLDVEI